MGTLWSVDGTTGNLSTPGNISLTGSNQLISSSNGFEISSSSLLSLNGSPGVEFVSSLIMGPNQSIIFENTTASHQITLTYPTISASYSLVLPSAQGGMDTVLQNDGSGNLSWASASSGSGTVNSGTAGQLAYYATSTNAVSGNSVVTYASNILTINGGANNTEIDISAGSSNTALLRLTGESLVYTVGITSAAVLSIFDVTNSRTIISYNPNTLACNVGTYTGSVVGIGISGGTITANTTIAMSSNKITALANGTAPSDAAAFGQIPVVASPTVQKFTSGSGTYTTPTSPKTPLYLKVTVVGPGGGGAGGGTTSNNGSAGSGATTFSAGSASAGAGSGGTSGTNGGSGGTNSISGGASIIAILGIAGGAGGGANYSSISGSSDDAGATGGSTPLGGGATGTVGTGNAGRANTGEGGAGGRMGSPGINNFNGTGGGGGGYLYYIVTSPTTSYTYSVGSGGAGGTSTAGGGGDGATGGSGVVIIEEYYQ